jgi:hypothetical protein
MNSVAFVILRVRLMVLARYYDGDQYAIETALAHHCYRVCVPASDCRRPPMKSESSSAIVGLVFIPATVPSR